MPRNIAQAPQLDNDGDIDSEDERRHIELYDLDGDHDVDTYDHLSIARSRMAALSRSEVRLALQVSMLCSAFLLAAIVLNLGPYYYATPAALKRQGGMRRVVGRRSGKRNKSKVS